MVVVDAAFAVAVEHGEVGLEGTAAGEGSIACYGAAGEGSIDEGVAYLLGDDVAAERWACETTLSRTCDLSIRACALLWQGARRTRRNLAAQNRT